MFGISIKDYLILKSIHLILYHCLYQWPLWENLWGLLCSETLLLVMGHILIHIFPSPRSCLFSHAGCLMVSRQTKLVSTSAACCPPARNITTQPLQMAHPPHFIDVFYKYYLPFFKCYFLTLPLKCYLLQ